MLSCCARGRSSGPIQPSSANSRGLSTTVTISSGGVQGNGGSWHAAISDNGRGTAEQWIKEGNQALRWTRLSCHAFRHNAVRLQLFALAYNLANFLRSLALPNEVAQWSLTTLREKLVKVGARIVRHGHYVIFQRAEVAVPRAVFAAILRLIADLRPWSPPLPA